MSDIDTLKETLDALTAQMEQARILLEEKKQEAWPLVLAKVQELIAEHNVDPFYIIDAIKPAKRPRAPYYPRYVDPNNEANVYTRGITPPWMLEAMRGLGLDPANKDDRERFKTEQLQKIERPAEAA